MRSARGAEQLGLGLLLFDDERGAPGAPAARWSPDPLEAAAHAAAVTDAVGLVVSAAATHAEPFHLSNRLSSLDWGSHGRAGWLVSIDTSSQRAAAYSAAVPDPRAARREAVGVVDAVARLWDSWEDGALIADSASGRFLDNSLLHYTDTGPGSGAGEFFRIRGPALMPRPVQGRPVIFAAADDAAGQALAGVDVTVVTVAPDADATSVAGQVATDPSARPTAARVTVSRQTTPGQLTALLRALAGRAAAVVLGGPEADVTLDLLTRVAPGLDDAGLLARPRAGQTLRHQLGLPRPASRYARSETPR